MTNTKRSSGGDVAAINRAHWLAERTVDRLHVAEPLAEVLSRLEHLTRNLKESLALQVIRRGLVRHLENRNTYREVMGQDPLPSEAMVGRAMLDRGYRAQLMKEMRT